MSDEEAISEICAFRQRDLEFWRGEEGGGWCKGFSGGVFGGLL